MGIATEREVNRDFIRAWKRAEKHAIKVPEERLYFLDAASLVKVLSNQRLHLLQTLREGDAVSIRKLAAMLNRDYSNVYNDVHLLMNAGLIRQTPAKTVHVPWDKIQTEIDLAA